MPRTPLLSHLVELAPPRGAEMRLGTDTVGGARPPRRGARERRRPDPPGATEEGRLLAGAGATALGRGARPGARVRRRTADTAADRDRRRGDLRA